MARFISANLKVDTRKWRQLTVQQYHAVEQMPEQAYKFWLKSTPIDSGNARRRTRLVADTIQADYAYAARLDSGYSRQSPEGMTEPTLEFIDRRYKEIMKGKI